MDDRMDRDIDQNRRLLAMTYRRYIEADLGWVRARRAARAWFPEESQPYRWTMGSPQSRLRQIYEQRERALVQLAAARQKFLRAKARMEKRPRVILILPGPLDDRGI